MVIKTVYINLVPYFIIKYYFYLVFTFIDINKINVSHSYYMINLRTKTKFHIFISKLAWHFVIINLSEILIIINHLSLLTCIYFLIYYCLECSHSSKSIAIEKSNVKKCFLIHWIYLILINLNLQQCNYILT